MARLRPVLNAILGLLLLVQVVAVAFANGDVAALDDASSTLQMPCHGDGNDRAPGTPPCCDHDCPDMTACMLGHFTVASLPVIWLAPGQPPGFALSAPPPRAAISSSLLRPPIPLLLV